MPSKLIKAASPLYFGLVVGIVGIGFILGLNMWYEVDKTIVALVFGVTSGLLLAVLIGYRKFIFKPLDVAVVLVVVLLLLGLSKCTSGARSELRYANYELHRTNFRASYKLQRANLRASYELQRAKAKNHHRQQENCETLREIIANCPPLQVRLPLQQQYSSPFLWCESLYHLLLSCGITSRVIEPGYLCEAVARDSTPCLNDISKWISARDTNSLRDDIQ